MHTSDQWRQQGNAAFGVDDFRQAVEYYSNALTCLEIMESAVGVHILLSNSLDQQLIYNCSITNKLSLTQTQRCNLSLRLPKLCTDAH